MKINSINHIENLGGDGLAAIKRDRFPRIVIVAGPNGSGKSRLLRRIISLAGCDQDPTPQHLSHLKQNAEKYLTPESGYKGSNLAVYSAPRFQDGKRYSLSSQGVILDQEGKFQIAEFSTSQRVPVDPSQQNPSKLKESMQAAQEPGLAKVSTNTFAYITKIQHQWREATHQECRLSNDEALVLKNSYEELCALIKTLIGTPLSRNSDGEVTLQGVSLAKSELSKGQLVLLQFAVALHAQEASLRNSILVFDEPETNLHAESLIDSMNRIADANEDGQMWIATHSVPLIAALNAKYDGEVALYCMEAGQLSYAGRRPERVLNSLLGGEANREALRRFIDLPTKHAFQNFSSQCLSPPEVIAGAASGDPQVEVIQKQLHKGRTQGKLLRVLDFGSGKGRLLDALNGEGNSPVTDWLDYLAYDPSDADKDFCQTAISGVYGEAQNRWFGDRRTLLETVDEQTVDVAILCNVLHEISPREWRAEFSDIGILRSLLKPDGFLFVVEDYLMPVGESAHDFGFVVLEQEPLRALFGLKASQMKSIYSERKGYEKRIQGHLIPAASMENVSQATCADALKRSQILSKEEIEKLRTQSKKGKVEYKDGLAMAFHTQQFANATLALEYFSPTG